jgi:hypothetical protein
LQIVGGQMEKWQKLEIFVRFLGDGIVTVVLAW